MLKMKDCCEQCRSPLDWTAIAYICSYECTFCQSCSQKMACICPNCQGSLVIRPTRTKSPSQALISQLKRKLFG